MILILQVVFPFVCLFIYLPVYFLSINQFVYLRIYRVYLPVYPFIHPSVYPNIYLSMYLTETMHPCARVYPSCVCPTYIYIYTPIFKPLYLHLHFLLHLHVYLLPVSTLYICIRYPCRYTYMQIICFTHMPSCCRSRFLTDLRLH